MKPFIVKFLESYLFGPRKSARWLIQVRINKNFGVSTTLSLWILSQWPVKGNSLIHAVLRATQVKDILANYGITKLNKDTTESVEIVAASNEVGPVGRESAFVISTKSIAYEEIDLQIPSDIKKKS